MLLQINRKHEKKIKIVGKAGPVTCHRISRSLSHHSANLLDLYTFFRRALNRAKYPEKHRIVAKSQQILRRMDDRSRRGSERGKVRNEAKDLNTITSRAPDSVCS